MSAYIRCCNRRSATAFVRREEKAQPGCPTALKKQIKFTSFPHRRGAEGRGESGLDSSGKRPRRAGRRASVPWAGPPPGSRPG